MGQKVGELSEDHIITHFFAPIATPLDDDAAHLQPPLGQELLVSTDALCQDVHFPAASPAALVAEKAVRANVSDIVACGGRPRWLTLCLSLPPELDASWLVQFSAGLKRAMSATGTSLIGGDTTASKGTINIAMTALGTVTPADRVGRRDARPGHLIAVTGHLGDAAAGLEVILERKHLEKAETSYWRDRHFLPPYRGDFAMAACAAKLISAMMDLSDGLSCDLARLCHASQVGANVDIDLLPLSRQGRVFGLTAQDALRGGEDYELLCCLPAGNWPALEEIAAQTATPLTRIGQIHASTEVCYTRQDKPLAVIPQSWRHFQ